MHDRALPLRTPLSLALACAFLFAPSARAEDPAEGAARGAADEVHPKGRADADRLAQRRRRRRAAEETPAAEPAAAADGEAAAGDGAVRGRVEEGAPNLDLNAPAAEGAAAEGDEREVQPGSGSLRRSNVMEFDARLVRGERAGSGAVVLFDRGQRPLPPLTRRRRRFLDPTIERVMGPELPDTAEPREVASADATEPTDERDDVRPSDGDERRESARERRRRRRASRR